MVRIDRVRLLWIVVLGAIVVGGTGAAYRVFFDRFRGNPRAPLVASTVAGITFVIITLVLLAWMDHRQKLKKRGPFS